MSKKQDLINAAHQRERESSDAARRIRCPWPGCTKERRRYSYSDSVALGCGGAGGRFAYCQEHINKSLDEFWRDNTNRIIRDAQ